MFTIHHCLRCRLGRPTQRFGDRACNANEDQLPVHPFAALKRSSVYTEPVLVSEGGLTATGYGYPEAFP